MVFEFKNKTDKTVKISLKVPSDKQCITDKRQKALNLLNKHFPKAVLREKCFEQSMNSHKINAKRIPY